MPWHLPPLAFRKGQVGDLSAKRKGWLGIIWTQGTECASL